MSIKIHNPSSSSGGASALDDLSDVTYSSGDLTISSLDTILTSGDLSFDADGDTIYFKGSGNPRGNIQLDSHYEIKSSTGNVLEINALSADLILDAGGGQTRIKKGGTQFAYFDTATANNLKLIGTLNYDLTLKPNGTGTVVLDKDGIFTATGTDTGLQIDFDQTGIIASGQTLTSIGLDLDMNCESITHVGTVNQTGIDLDMVAATDGTQSNIGIDINVSGADTNYALITSGGNVGIGVSDPDELLEVAGDVKISGDNKLYFYDTGGESIYSNGTHLTLTSGDRIVLDAEGDIILDANGGNITLHDNASTYTPSAGSDATTKTYVDDAILAAQFHFIRFGAYISTASNSFLFIAGAENQRDTTSSSGGSENLVFVAPYDGVLVKAIVRSEAACDSSVINWYRDDTPTGSELPSILGGATQSVTVDMSVDDTSYEFDFTGGTNDFDKGDIMMWSFDPTNIPYDTHMVIVLKFDTTT
tara:strand:+ start:4354 stop:5781 length:1428 start_codon:yes stop_codon:yes gene_type:complete